MILAAVAVVGAVVVWTVAPTYSGGEDTSTTETVHVGAGTPSEALERYLTSWRNGDYNTMREVTGELPASFVEQHLSWHEILDLAEVELSAGMLQPTGGGRASAPITITFDFITGDSWSYETRLEVFEDDGRWLVDWSPAVLHPSLRSDDRLEPHLIWPERARILARDGTPLTDDRRVVVIGVVPERIEEIDDVTEALLEYTGVEPDRVRDALSAPSVQPDWFLPMTMLRPAAYREVRPDLFPVPGIVFREATARLAPDEGFASHVLGRVSEITAEQLEELGDPYSVGDLVGSFGLERAFEAELAGSPSIGIRRLSGSGETLEVLFTASGRDPEPVQTTLDMAVQRAAERALATTPEPSALVALDAETGEIRAVVSRPLDGFNRAISGQYPPGSTFKIITAAALIGEGFTPDSPVDCPAEVLVEGRTFSNVGGFALGSTPLVNAFARSCNTTFASMGAGLDNSVLEAAARGFGFGELYDLPLGVAGGRFPAPRDRADQAAASIGQGQVLASPLHMATVAAAVASGEWSPPSLLPDTEIERRPVQIDVSPLQDMMRAVVTAGTGTAVDLEGEPVSGKTGSAEFGSGDSPDTHAWFVGYRDGLAFAVLIEGGGSGGEVAAPIAAEFLRLIDEERAAGAAPLATCQSSAWPTFQGTNTRSGCAEASAVLQPRILWRQHVGIQGWLNNPVIVDNMVYVGSAGEVRGAGDAGDRVYALSLRDGRVLWSHNADNDVNGVSVSDGVVVSTDDYGSVWGLDADDGSILWSFPDEGEASGPLFTSPLLIDGMAIVGGTDGILYALDLETGRVKWRVELDSPIRGGAASDGEAIYVIGEAGDARALSLDGRQYWREKLTFANHAAEVLTARVFAPPTLVGDLVVVSYIRDDAYPVPALIALDRYTGSIRWEASDPDRIREAWGNLRSSPAVVDGELVFGDPTFAGILAVDAVDGSALWAIEGGKHCLDQWPSPVRVGPLVVLPQADGGLYAFDLEDSSVEWSIYLGEAGQGGDFPVGFEAMSCSILDPIFASPAVAPDGSIVVGTSEGYVFRIVDSG